MALHSLRGRCQRTRSDISFPTNRLTPSPEERPLSKDDLVALESVVKISGARYDPAQMKLLDSERR
ncbi:Aldo-keto reductase [Cystobacter fuscus DSM 2262]|uniref:Aldo-keto reductase n=1 Tax=Cystobacter fuscus (strain ATCC 25194 / DSM 2262 / NBRC 100088 / M29) TaxID=1242864 RepID=S9R168_CYSF2|nr:Aldo-keto reductase [Cystobacter fuscus DSM 2262]